MPAGRRIIHLPKVRDADWYTFVKTDREGLKKMHKRKFNVPWDMENRARLHNALINVIKYTDDYYAGKPAPRASGVIVLEDCGLGILSFRGSTLLKERNETQTSKF